MHFDLAGLFLAGLLTFASPCVLPLVPIYLGLLGGASAEGLRGGVRPRLVARAAAFSLGLATVFVALGLAASAAGRLLAAHRALLLAASGLVMIGFGLRFLGLLRLPFLDRERRPWLQRLAPGASLLAAFAFGGAFALGWTPCIGPVLGSVLTYTAGSGASPARGALYLGLYAAGLTLPLLAAATFAPFVLGALDRLKPHLRRFEIATGLLLVGAGALIMTDRLMILLPPAKAPAARAPGALARSSRPGSGAACSAAGDGSTCEVPDSAAPPAFLAASAQVHGPAVVEVMSAHCPICRLMAPSVEAAEQGCPMKVVREYVEQPAGADLARRYAIRGVPTFLVLDGSDQAVQRLVGQSPPEAIRSALERASARACDSSPGAARGS